MIQPIEKYKEGLEILTHWQEEIQVHDPENPNPWVQVRLDSLIQTTENTIKLIERVDLLLDLLDKAKLIQALLMLGR